MAKWLKKYDTGGPIGPKAAPIKINGTEVFEHGEDTATANKQENGINPTNLTEKGVKYAKSVGQEALKRGKKAILTSDVQRAKETADVIGQTAGLPVYNNPVLRTWDIGEYDGAPEGSFKEKQWAAKSSTPVPGGESFDSFAARMEKAFEFANNAPKDDDIVTHSKVTRAFKALHDTDGQWTDKTTKKFLEAKDEPKKENGGWLNKYEQGGMVLEKKGDNYGKQSNYNDAKDSTGPGFVGLGYGASNWKSPAWGGQFQNGGNLWNTDKKAFVDSTLNANKNLDFVHRLYDPSLGSIQIPGEHGRSTHYMANDKTRVYPEVVNIHGKLQYLPGDKGYDYADSTGEYINFKTPEQAEWFASSRDNTSGYKMGTNVLSKIDPKTGKPKMQMGGSMPGAVGFTYARTAGSAPANGKYTKKTKASAQNGKEMSFYQNGLDFTPKNISKNGSVIEDDMGQWAHPGEVTRINSNNITMEGVDYPILGVSDTGHQQMMYPDQHYKFEGKKVTEYPMAQDGWLSKSIDAVGNAMSAPARGLTYLATGKYQDPSEALGITNPYAKFATDAVLDPLNLIGGVGLINDARKVGKEAKLLEEASKVKKAAEPLATSRLRSMEEVREYNKNLGKTNAPFRTGAAKELPDYLKPFESKDKNGGWLEKYK